MGKIADYTIGLVIVLGQLLFIAMQERRRAQRALS